MSKKFLIVLIVFFVQACTFKINYFQNITYENFDIRFDAITDANTYTLYILDDILYSDTPIFDMSAYASDRYDIKLEATLSDTIVFYETMIEIDHKPYYQTVNRLDITDNTLSFSPIDTITNYELSINGVTQTIENAFIDLSYLEEGFYHIKIKALYPSGGRYGQSILWHQKDNVETKTFMLDPLDNQNFEYLLGTMEKEDLLFITPFIDYDLIDTEEGLVLSIPKEVIDSELEDTLYVVFEDNSTTNVLEFNIKNRLFSYLRGTNDVTFDDTDMEILFHFTDQAVFDINQLVKNQDYLILNQSVVIKKSYLEAYFASNQQQSLVLTFFIQEYQKTHIGFIIIHA